MEPLVAVSSLVVTDVQWRSVSAKAPGIHIKFYPVYVLERMIQAYRSRAKVGIEL